MKKCFVISPIGDEGSEIRKRSDQLFKHVIKPICEENGLEVTRLDQINTTGSITVDLIEQIKTSGLVIADLTGHNPNVFYEVGYRTALSLPIVHLKQKDEMLPFDVTTIRTYDYDLSDLDSVDVLKQKLNDIISRIEFDNMTKVHSGSTTLISNKDIELQYEILESIKSLENTIKEKDDSTLQKIMETAITKAVPQETTETAMMKAIMPALLSNPDTLEKLMLMGEKNKKK